MELLALMVMIRLQYETQAITFMIYLEYLGSMELVSHMSSKMVERKEKHQLHQHHQLGVQANGILITMREQETEQQTLQEITTQEAGLDFQGTLHQF